MQAVVVLSGGQDSALCLALAVKKYGSREVAAITFAYGQRHSVETKFAKRLVKTIPAALRTVGVSPTGAGKILHKVVRLGFYRDITANALLDPTMKIGWGKDGRRKSEDGRTTPPNTVVEGRNAFFLMAAAVWAKSLGATDVYTGVSQADYSGYPDCRAVFIRAQQKAIRLALDFPIRIVTPFMRKTKAEEWALAAKLGVFDLIANGTVTCYNGIPGKGCGKCPACKLRNRGLKEYLRVNKSNVEI